MFEKEDENDESVFISLLDLGTDHRSFFEKYIILKGLPRGMSEWTGTAQ